MDLLLIFLVIGMAAGLLTGLFGIGGGLVLVPALVWMLSRHDVASDTVMQMAVGTSLAVIAVTSISSTCAHHARGGVRWSMVWSLAPGLVLGALVGAWTAHGLSGVVLARAVGIGALVVAAIMWFRAEPRVAVRTPGAFGLGTGGVAIGWASSVIGIGGGSLLVPFLRFCGLEMRQTAGCSAASGMTVASAGATGFAVAGWSEPSLPVWHLGYVWLPGFAALALVAVLVAPAGALLAHRLPQRMLQRLFVLLPLSVGLIMLISPP